MQLLRMWLEYKVDERTVTGVVMCEYGSKGGEW